MYIEFEGFEARPWNRVLDSFTFVSQNQAESYILRNDGH